MNIKDIIKKVLNENTNPIIKLLNKRGIDPIKNVTNTIDFMENTLGLDSNEITDTYKSILGDNITEDTYFNIFNNIFQPEEIILDTDTLYKSVIFLKNGGGKVVMILTLPGFYPNKPKYRVYNDLCPMLDIEYVYKVILDKIFGNTWRGPFKKWVHNQFGETVKTIQ
jgi:hypothetical protein